MVIVVTKLVHHVPTIALDTACVLDPSVDVMLGLVVMTVPLLWPLILVLTIVVAMVGVGKVLRVISHVYVRMVIKVALVRWLPAFAQEAVLVRVNVFHLVAVLVYLVTMVPLVRLRWVLVLPATTVLLMVSASMVLVGVTLVSVVLIVVKLVILAVLVQSDVMLMRDMVCVLMALVHVGMVNGRESVVRHLCMTRLWEPWCPPITQLVSLC